MVAPGPQAWGAEQGAPGLLHGRCPPQSRDPSCGSSTNPGSPRRLPGWLTALLTCDVLFSLPDRVRSALPVPTRTQVLPPRASLPHPGGGCPPPGRSDAPAFRGACVWPSTLGVSSKVRDGLGRLGRRPGTVSSQLGCWAVALSPKLLSGKEGCPAV